MLLISYTFFSQCSNQANFERLLVQLPSNMQGSVTRYKRPETRWASLLGKLLVQHGFSELGCSDIWLPGDLQYSKYNRPFIAGSCIDFNIAHSAGCVVSAITTHGRVGVDIEQIRPIDIESYYQIMLEDERVRIQQSGDKLLSFYKYWTEKECVIKADGKGLNIPLNSFHVENNKACLNRTNWYIREVPVSDRYVCRLAVGEQAKKLPTWVKELTF